jgi:hypothetical protein
MPILTTFGAASFADITFRRGSDGGVQERVRRYFYNTVNGAWLTIGNWFSDLGHFVSTGSIPTSGNDAIILTDCTADLDDLAWTVPGSIEVTGDGTGGGYTLTLFSITCKTFPKTIDITGAGWVDLDGVNYA